MKKQYFLIIAAFLLGLSGCEGKPNEAFGKTHYKKVTLAKYAGRASVIAFKQTKAQEGIFFGLKAYDMEYEYELACNADIQITELEMIPVDDVARMEDYLARQTGDWDKLNFAPFSNIRIDGIARDALYKAYTKKTSLFFCRLGDKVKGRGHTRFLLRENGWEAER